MPLPDLILSLGPKDGDPMAWTVALACLAAAVLAGSVALYRRGRELIFWLLVALVMVALGLNSHLDLQADLARAFQALVHEQGWDADRHQQQLAFAVLLAAGLGWAGLLLGWLAARAGHAVWAALAGLAMAASLVPLRAASLQPVDIALRAMVAGTTLDTLIEIGGALLVILAAFAARLRLPSQRRGSSSEPSP